MFAIVVNDNETWLHRSKKKKGLILCLIIIIIIVLVSKLFDVATQDATPTCGSSSCCS